MLSQEKQKTNSKDIGSNDGQMGSGNRHISCNNRLLRLFFQDKVLKAINSSSPSISETVWFQLKKKKRNEDEADQSNGDYR